MFVDKDFILGNLQYYLFPETIGSIDAVELWKEIAESYIDEIKFLSIGSHNCPIPAYIAKTYYGNWVLVYFIDGNQKTLILRKNS